MSTIHLSRSIEPLSTIKNTKALFIAHCFLKYDRCTTRSQKARGSVSKACGEVWFGPRDKNRRKFVTISFNNYSYGSFQHVRYRSHLAIFAILLLRTLYDYFLWCIHPELFFYDQCINYSGSIYTIKNMRGSLLCSLRLFLMYSWINYSGSIYILYTKYERFVGMVRSAWPHTNWDPIQQLLSTTRDLNPKPLHDQFEFRYSSERSLRSI